MAVGDSKEHPLRQWLDELTFLSNETDAVLCLWDPSQDQLYLTGPVEEVFHLSAPSKGIHSRALLEQFLGPDASYALHQDAAALLSGQKELCRRNLLLKTPEGNTLSLHTASKRQGQNTHWILTRLSSSPDVFSPAGPDGAEEESPLVKVMRESVARDCQGFFLLFQPQIECENYDLHGLEALLRFRTEEQGIVSPNEFIPLLESTGLIVPVGHWVLKTAIEHCARWRAHLPELHISVNVSYLQFRQPDFGDQVLELLEKTGLPGSALTLEVTESMQLQDHRYFNRVFSRLQKQGVQISIDDFGTGYSSLSYLKLLSINEVKIDRCFISRIQHSAYNCRLVSNIIELARSAQIQVCCEGLETEQEFMVLHELHPNLIQGYLFAKPYDADQFMRRFIDSTNEEFYQRQQRRNYYRNLALRDTPNTLKIEEQERLSTIVDGMEELVYVRDLENYDLLYMNAVGREMTGIYDYKGRKCYQVLVDRKTPCDTCTAACLNLQAYQVRERWNAYLQRHFMLKEKLIYWRGKLAGLAVGIDLTEKEITSQRMQEKLEFKQNIEDCTKMLLEETDLQKAISGLLRTIGEFYNADRAYLFEMQDNRQFWDNTYEWCASGVEPEIDFLQDVPISTTKRWMELFRVGESIIIDDIEDIKETSPEEYETLAVQNITHLIVSPVWHNQRVIGFIGVDNPRKHLHDVSHVQTISLFLADRILKDQTKDRLKELLNLHYSDILKTTQLGLWLIRLSKDGKRTEMYADQTMRMVLGIREALTPEECYHHWYSRIKDGYFHYVNYSVQNMINTGHTVELSYTWNHPEKGEVTVRCLGTRVEDMGDMICLEGYHREINQVDRAHFLPDEKSIIFEYNEDQRSIYFHNSRAPLAGAGEKEEDFPGCWLRQGIVHPHFLQRFASIFSNIRNSPELEGEELLLKTTEGTYEWFKMKTRYLGDSQQDAKTMVVILDPAKQERAMELEFLRQKDFYRAILSESIAYAEIDMESHEILSAGGLWEQCQKQSQDYLNTLLQCGELTVYPEDAAAYCRFLSEETLSKVIAAQKDREKLQLRCFVAGHLRWVELTGHVFRDHLTENVYALLYVQDIDARKQRELEQEKAATRDPLTHVFNRSAFQREVMEHIARSRTEIAGALVILDLDNFKSINDTYGHAEGDRVLQQLADVLLTTFRRKDLIGRFGGDEFLIFLKDLSDKDVIDRRMKELRRSLLTMSRHGCTCSVGITFVRRKDFHYETHLKEADQALYYSKKQGKNTYSYASAISSLSEQ